MTNIKRILLFLSFIIIPLTIFLQLDSDILIYFSPSPPSNSYLNKVIWITGSSSGIGASLALELNKLGANVIITARREDKLNIISKQSNGINPMFILPFNIINYTSQIEAYNLIIKKYGHIDMLILNAGQSQRNSAINTLFNDTKELMELNYFSCVHLAKLVLPDMITNGGGKVFIFCYLYCYLLLFLLFNCYLLDCFD